MSDPIEPTEAVDDDASDVAAEASQVLPEVPLMAELAAGFPESVWGTAVGQTIVELPAAQLRAFGEAARAAGFEMLADLTAVDYLGHRRTRFEVVANFLSVEHGLRIRVRCPLPADDPTIPSLVPVYPGANFFEREVYDMFGITFEGHPDLTRILMPDDWQGHPLRKDFGVGDVPVQFKAANKVT